MKRILLIIIRIIIFSNNFFLFKKKIWRIIKNWSRFLEEIIEKLFLILDHLIDHFFILKITITIFFRTLMDLSRYLYLFKILFKMFSNTKNTSRIPRQGPEVLFCSLIGFLFNFSIVLLISCIAIYLTNL